MITYVVCLLWFQVVCASSTEKLFFYGEPTLSTTTGFIKMNPQTTAWEPAANGFATQRQTPYDAYKGVLLGEDGSSYMYGQFSLWNGSYVGCMVRLDLDTMEPFLFNTGVLGDSVDGMQFFNNNTEIAILGAFDSFQQNPSENLGAVGACTVSGKSCRSLGNGLDGYSSKSLGILRSLDGILYAMYDTATSIVVASFNTTSNDENWNYIFTSNKTDRYQISMEVYMGDIWLFGSVYPPYGPAVGAAKWNRQENTWEYMYNSTFPNDGEVHTTVSPDGSNAFMEMSTGTSTTMYRWNATEGKWNDFYVATCSTISEIAALNGGDLLISCSESILRISASQESQELPGINCSKAWIGLEVSLDSSQLFAFCEIDPDLDILLSFSYNLTQQTISVVSNISSFEQVIASLGSMCTYGQKIFISGIFSDVGGVGVQSGLAIWDSNYQKWYAINESDILGCACASNDTQLIAGCYTTSMDYPILLIDNANSDSGTGVFIQGIQTVELTELENIPYISQLSIVNGELYISATGAINCTLASWNADTGIKVIVTAAVNYWYFSVVNTTAYFSGQLWASNSSSQIYVTTAQYDMASNTWLPMDQLATNKKDRVFVLDQDYWELLNEIFVGGNFDEAGSINAWNLVGFNLAGQAVEAVSGGLTGWVTATQPIGDQLFFLTQSATCEAVRATNCLYLQFYDSQSKSYSPVITQGVVYITSGKDVVPEASSSSGGHTDSAWTRWGILFICVISITGILVIAGAVFFFRSKLRHRNFYQEIPEIGSTSYDATVDFQHEEFVMKSVLGRGAYGTVWSCVFPHREGGTYAVKQMLFSKGEVKKIEVVQKEIDILEKFRHPHIVHYCGHRVETTPTSVEFFIFMELYDQPCSLKGVIQKRLKQAQKSGKNQWFTYDEIKNYLFQIADGLNYLHTSGVAHRDLKCANILVRTKGAVITTLHISDFGISRVMNAEGGEANMMASTVLGTPSFMAPEIFKNQPYDPFKADMWSFGMLIFEMVTWKEPEIPGKKPSLPEPVLDFMNSDSRFVSVLEIFDRCSQQEPAARPDSSELLSLCEYLP